MRRLTHICREAVRLAWPYLGSEDRVAAWLLLLAILALTLANVGVGLLISFSQRLFYSALQEKHAYAFIRALFWFTPRSAGVPIPPFLFFVTVNIASTCVSLYLQAVLQLRWQRWLTTRVVGQWLSNHAYYHLPLLGRSGDPSADNPDQRIQEDIEDATRNVIAFAAGLLSSLASMVSFGGLLYTLSEPITFFGKHIGGYLLWSALLYAAVCTAIAHLAGQSIAGINFVRQRFRGDFRLSLVRVRENAEEIAFLRGETAETTAISASFSSYYRTSLRLVMRTSGLTFLSNMSEELAIVFPTVIAAPRFFAGQISFGTLNQVRLAFLQLAEAALWFVSTYAQLADFVSQLQRLSTLQEALIRLAHDPGTLARHVDGNRAVVNASSLTSAAGDIITGSFEIDIAPGHSTAITGPSGAGKTTMLRILAGLWKSATGYVVVPHSGAVFVPQRAYLPSGPLRRALCYPADPLSFSDAELEHVLDLVGLAEMKESLDVLDDWARRMSFGQQQRLALGRAILQRPSWLFLDEPTSSLHPQARIALHDALATALPSTTIVTITHDPSVAARHDCKIGLMPIPKSASLQSC